MIDPYTSAVELRDAIRQRLLSPVEVVDAYIDRIDRIDPIISAFVYRADDEARTEAKRAERELRDRELSELPPFHGVPIPIKAMNRVRGWPTFWGQRRLSPADADDVTVDRLRRAGFIPFGVTSTVEVSVGRTVAEGSEPPPTRNPWNLDRSPGGSSDGAAAALAAGLAPITHGSDGGGSIRIPAANCALVGLKASRSRVPADVNGLEGMGVEGVLTRTVADSAAAFIALAVHDPLAWFHAPPLDIQELDGKREPLRIGVCLEPPAPAEVTKECENLATEVGSLLSELGHEVSQENPFDFDPEEFERDFKVIWYTAAAGLPFSPEVLCPSSRLLYEEGKRLDQLSYVGTVTRLQALTRSVLAAWGTAFDVLVTPTKPSAATPLGWLYENEEHDPWDPFERDMQAAAFTGIANVLGVPALTLPMGESREGLPLGVQLIGGPWQDLALLRLAAQLEEARPWAHRRPHLVDQPKGATQ